MSNVYESGPTVPAAVVTRHQSSKNSGALNLEGKQRRNEGRILEEENIPIGVKVNF